MRVTFMRSSPSFDGWPQYTRRPRAPRARLGAGRPARNRVQRSRRAGGSIGEAPPAILIIGGCETMADYKIYSADSHMSEPGDLWVERIDKKYQFRAPRIEQRERNGKIEDLWIYEGFPPHPVGVGLGAAARNGESFREQGKGYGDALSGG